MLKKYADRWVKALRSGKYKQGRSYLKNGDKFCCLGVLCEILEIPAVIVIDAGNLFQYNGFVSSLSYPVCSKTKMRSQHGSFFDKGEERSLSDLNDEGKTFLEIADIIEANYKVI